MEPCICILAVATVFISTATTIYFCNYFCGSSSDESQSDESHCEYYYETKKEDDKKDVDLSSVAQPLTHEEKKKMLEVYMKKQNVMNKISEKNKKIKEKELQNNTKNFDDIRKLLT